MRIREWQDIVEDVVERDVGSAGWRAVGGSRGGGVGEDMYLAHPQVGLYQLKTYAKNPFEVKGVGARVARNLDDEIGQFFPDENGPGRFAVQTRRDEDERAAEQRAKRVEETIKAHADAPTTPGDLFDDVMDALESPAFGPMEFDNYDRPDSVDDLSSTLEEAEELLEAEFKDIVDDDGVGRGFQ